MLINIRKGRGGTGVKCSGPSDDHCPQNRATTHPDQLDQMYLKQCDPEIRAKLTQLQPEILLHPRLIQETVWSQENKMDEIRFGNSAIGVRECCVHIFTDAWLHHNILDHLTMFCTITIQDSYMKRGGGSVFTSVMLKCSQSKWMFPRW